MADPEGAQVAGAPLSFFNSPLIDATLTVNQ